MSFKIVTLDSKTTTVTSQESVNHVYVVDVSGSMHSSLPRMRQNLKNIMSLVTKPMDTFSIIYFSGKGQCGTICEGVQMDTVSGLSLIGNVVDKYLKPIGLTGFKEPLELAAQTAKNINNDNQNNFVMLTDGYDNQFTRKQIMEAVNKLPEVFNSITFIEYGYYCDRELLADMASSVGGRHIFMQGINEYEQRFSDTLSSKFNHTKRVDVELSKVDSVAVYRTDDELICVDIKNKTKIKVPETTNRVITFDPCKLDLSIIKHDIDIYMIMFWASTALNNKLVWECLEQLGDVYLIDLYTNAFSKQELSTFQKACQMAAVDEEKRYLKGKDVNYAPPANAITVLDVLYMIDELQGATLEVDSDFFEYSSVSRKTEAVDELPRFKMKSGATAITGIVYNSSRPNISIQTMTNGVVEVPENDFGLKLVESKITRNYTVIRDGLLNIECLPVTMRNNDVQKFRDSIGENVEIVSNETTGRSLVVINLKGMPVISRNMTSKVDVKTFARLVTRIEEHKAELKALKDRKKDVGEIMKVADLSYKYGPVAAKWLSTIGVRDYGLSPRVASCESDDVYMSVEMSTKVKGLSSLPSVDKVRDKIESGKKLTLGESLVEPGLNLSDDKVQDRIKFLDRHIRELRFELTLMTYGIILGRSWFSDTTDNPATVDVQFTNGATTSVTIEKVQKEVKI